MIIKNARLPLSNHSTSSGHVHELHDVQIIDGIIRAIMPSHGIVNPSHGIVNPSASAEHSEEDAPLTVDLHGKSLLPGFNDSHMHLLGYGKSLYDVLLTDASSIDDMVSITKAWIATNQPPKGTFIQGRGWNQDHFQCPSLPSRHDLDRVSTVHPIVLSRACGHILVANSTALELAGISEETRAIDGGSIDTDATGVPTGILRENARNLVLDLIPTPDTKTLQQYILRAQEELFKHGITSVQSDDLCVFPIEDTDDILEAFQTLGNDGRLILKVHEQSLFRTSDNLLRCIHQGYAFGKRFGNFTHGPLKILGDGSLGARTALLKEPYSDDPATKGIALYTQSELDEMVRIAAENGIPSVIHGIGDGMIDMALDAISKAPGVPQTANLQNTPLRHGIVHCQITGTDQIERMQELGVHALVQPIFLDYDLHMAEDRVGIGRASTSYAFNTMIEKGIHAPFGTDCPVEGPSVFNCIQCAVTRKDLLGRPETPWYPDEAVDMKKALHAYTVEGAWASYEESSKGRIEVGYQADLIAVDTDPLAVAPSSIKDMRVIMTMVDGRIVHSTLDQMDLLDIIGIGQ